MKSATTVTKLCRVMEQFQNRQSFGITDLAHRAELLPSDVHRLLTSLRVFGYVEQDPETKKYRLGISLLRLATFHREQLCGRARPVLVQLSRHVAAATWLALLDRREMKMFVLDQVKGPTDSVCEDNYGGSERLQCTALGKTIIANLSPDVAFSALEKSELKKYTRHTVTDRSVLQRQFQEIRRLGYAVDREEYMDGLCCLASPLRSRAGSVIGAISASMSSSRFAAWDESRLGAHLKAAALRMSATLGDSRAALI
jgi:IclR family KDG regulon transcriptional repressor